MGLDELPDEVNWRAPLFGLNGEPISLREWADLFANRKKKVLAVTSRNQVWVSTVWLGTDLGWEPGGEPVIFETMAFVDHARCHRRRDVYCDRYATAAEARRGHGLAVELVHGSHRRKTDAYTWAKRDSGRLGGLYCPRCGYLPPGKNRPKGKGPRTIRHCSWCMVKWRAGFRTPRRPMRDRWLYVV